MAKLTFHGAAQTVTGSKFLLEAGGARVLVDCGLFQGLKALRELNWRPTPFDVKSLDAVVLTHAHLDHTGYLPRIVAEGYSASDHRHEGHESAHGNHPARLGPLPGVGRRIRQSQGLFEAQAGAAAVRRQRRAENGQAARRAKPRRVVLAGRADLDALSRRRPSARLEHDRSRNSRSAAAAADSVFRRRRPLRRAAVSRPGAAARVRLSRLRKHLRRSRSPARVDSRRPDGSRPPIGGARRRDADRRVCRGPRSAVDLPAAGPQEQRPHPRFRFISTARWPATPR